ncbi:hypothetical protein TNCV_140481 [Trichonephila clavipes]|uniref:Uncharacterized protein n=1 Tax=Trichonephila clavipes TaxID=2585209 RepID=A0A8X6V4R5_TRICX|nr:hypothetical protein TNCV_140481 [Trichonephila clavipes]
MAGINPENDKEKNIASRIKKGPYDCTQNGISAKQYHAGHCACRMLNSQRPDWIGHSFLTSKLSKFESFKKTLQDIIGHDMNRDSLEQTVSYLLSAIDVVWHQFLYATINGLIDKKLRWIEACMFVLGGRSKKDPQSFVVYLEDIIRDRLVRSRVT